MHTNLPGRGVCMCGRYYIDPDTEDSVERLFRIRPDHRTAGDVTPGMSPLVLHGRSGKMSADAMYWGMTGQNGSMIINARSENIYDRPMFRNSIADRRLVIPAAGFYEWDRERNKVTFHLPDSGPLFLAGIYTLDRNKEAFVILTTSANRSVESVHDRMPVIIPARDVADWLFEPGKTREFLQTVPPMLTSEREYEQISLFQTMLLEKQ